MLTKGMGYYADGEAEVYADRDCQSDRMYFLDLSCWKLISSDAVPHLDRMDGNSSLRVGAADAIEGRWKGYYNLVCSLPGANGVAQIA